MNPSLLGNPFAFKDTRLCLTKKVAKRLLAEAQEAFPDEYSALLYGKGASISGHIPMPAHTADAHSFRWDGPSFLAGLRHIHEAGQEWLGVLHSHPSTPPLPSAKDEQGWHYPTLSYWILGLSTRDPEWKVYRWENEGFSECAYLLADCT